MTVMIERDAVVQAVKALGLDPLCVNEIVMQPKGITIKTMIRNDKGRFYWDEAYDGPAYEYVTHLLRQP